MKRDATHVYVHYLQGTCVINNFFPIYIYLYIKTSKKLIRIYKYFENYLIDDPIFFFTTIIILIIISFLTRLDHLIFSDYLRCEY